MVPAALVCGAVLDCEAVDERAGAFAGTVRCVARKIAAPTTTSARMSINTHFILLQKSLAILMLKSPALSASVGASGEWTGGVGLYGRPWVGMLPVHRRASVSGEPRRATIKAHPSPLHTLAPTDNYRN